MVGWNPVKELKGNTRTAIHSASFVYVESGEGIESEPSGGRGNAQAEPVESGEGIESSCGTSELMMQLRWNPVKELKGII